MKKIAIAIILTLLTMYVGLRISSSRSFQFFGGIVQSVNTEEKVVAITFDDGPTEKTGEILSLLRELEIPATFFVTGRELEENMEAGKSIVLAGHELANHSFSHQRMVLKSPSFIRNEIRETDRLIRQAGYTGEIHFRPPFGKKFIFLPGVLRVHNRKTIMWNLEPDSDPAVSSEDIVTYLAENISPGSIILLHIMYESRENSRQALPGVVAALKEKGYRFVTVSELLQYQ